MNTVQRNPLLTINGKTVQVVGDAHLGRVYSNGVPLHMRGKMEKLQREKFTSLLADSAVDYLVLIGDLFDSFVVDPTTVDFAARAILAAARSNGSRTLVLLGGNHDESKDLTAKSSFDNLKLTLREAALDNLVIVDDVLVKDQMGFMSWSARHSAKEQAENLIHRTDKPLNAVFCHCDVVLPENANHYNMVPTSVLKNITNLIVTGHVHKPDVIERDNVEIILSGSLLPLAHGEELPEDKMFYTLSRADYDKDPKAYENTFVRFVLAEGEELPEGDFLQVKAYTKSATEDEPESETEDFDLIKALTKFLNENELPETRVAEVTTRFKERNIAE